MFSKNLHINFLHRLFLCIILLMATFSIHSDIFFLFTMFVNFALVRTVI